MMSGMNEIEDRKTGDGPVVSEGGRSPSTLSPGHTASVALGAPTVEPLGPGQRWSAGRKRAVVLRLLAGDSVELLSRELGLPVFKLEQWRQKAEAALDSALKEREANVAEDGQLAAALRRVGELSMENELLRSRIERPGPLGRRRSR
jgi:transposase-like protein